MIRRGQCVLAAALIALSAEAAGAARAAPGVQAVYPRAAVADAIDEASRRFGIPVEWIRQVIRAESGGDPGAVSPAGATGLMQIMPATYADLRQRHGLGSDPFAVRDNVIAGTAYLRELHDRYGAFGMLAAYNAGPGRWEDHLATGRPLPNETQRYLARLSPAIAPRTGGDLPVTAVTLQRSPSAVPIFVARTTAASPIIIGAAPFDRTTSGPPPVNVAAERSVDPPSSASGSNTSDASQSHPLLPRSGTLFAPRSPPVASR